MPSLSITWHTMGDNNVCPVCRVLEGYTWTFELGKDQFTNELIHPQFGVVWTASSGSATHEYGHRTGGFPSNCRCHFEPHVDASDWVPRIQRLLSILEATVQTGNAKGDEELV